MRATDPATGDEYCSVYSSVMIRSCTFLDSPVQDLRKFQRDNASMENMNFFYPVIRKPF
jgi:hypothetical protein